MALLMSRRTSTALSAVNGRMMRRVRDYFNTAARKSKS